MNLLYTNQQIYEEASKIFWDKTMISFDNSDEFVAVIRSLSEESRAKLKKLSLLATDDTPGGRSYSINEALRAVCSLHNLRELEMAPQFVGWVYRYPFHQLRHCNVASLVSIRCPDAVSTPNVGAGYEIWMKVSKQVEPIDITRRCPKAMSSPVKCIGCSLCDYKSHEALDDLWNSETYTGMFTLERTVTTVSRHSVARRLQQNGVPIYKGRAVKPFGQQCFNGEKVELAIFGLPAHTRRQRQHMLNLMIQSQKEERDRVAGNTSGKPVVYESESEQNEKHETRPAVRQKSKFCRDAAKSGIRSEWVDEREAAAEIEKRKQKDEEHRRDALREEKQAERARKKSAKKPNKELALEKAMQRKRVNR
jgi:hypothetical protein